MDTETETEKIIKKQLKILPKEIKDFFVDPKINQQVLEIGKGFNLDIEKVGVLQIETTLLILGLTNPDEYPNELKNRLKVGGETLNNIVQKINTIISPEILRRLKEIYKKTEDESREEKNKIIEKIKAEISLLPKEEQEMVNGFGWEKITAEIGKNYKLTEDEINALKIEIILIIAEFADKGLFELNIEDRIGTNEDTSKKIAEEIDQKIFKPMYDKLTENIKKTLKIRSIHWQQNLNFILSGGDYTAFIRRVESRSIGQNISDVKKEFNPSKLDDLKSKFTI